MLSFIAGLALLAIPVGVASSEPPSTPLIGTYLPSGEELVFKMDLDEVIDMYALKHELSQEKRDFMERVIKCESSGVSDAVGDSGNSYGLAQWHIPAGNLKADGTPITQEDALNPFVALDEMARYFKEDKEHLWTCARNE